MMNPYSVLGVPPDATQEEISKAYKRLAKKYHPDLHPGDKDAAEKMSRINEAYNMLRSGKTGTDSGYQNTYRSYRNTYSDYRGGSYREQYEGFYSSGNPVYENARAAIRNRQNFEALRILQAMTYRDAEWYYLSAVANYNLGNKAAATEYASVAVKCDPSNTAYRDFLNRISSTENYTRRSSTYTPSAGQICYRGALFALCLLCTGGRCVPCFWC